MAGPWQRGVWEHKRFDRYVNANITCWPRWPLIVVVQPLSIQALCPSSTMNQGPICDSTDEDKLVWLGIIHKTGTLAVLSRESLP
jgi:hypothetical protein